ncbi:MAG: 16S rRNA (adenine(1518)-N(6)/adenine(1519)-N(6))-dimethyltransferase RsmA [Chloroflexota bacterium]
MKETSLLSQTRQALRRFDLKARRALGQHFLVDAAVLQLIVDTAALTSEDTVIEVGPGLGVLTRELAERAGRLYAIELDDRLAEILRRNLASLPNVTVMNENVLDVDPASLIPEGTPYRVVANLPYYITSPVLRHFLEARHRPDKLLVMVQKEVAEVITAAAGQRSLLSIGVQLYGRPEIVSRVPAAAFYPPPKVDSALLKIDVYPGPAVPVDDVKGFFHIVRAGFTTPRKQLANSLAKGLAADKAPVKALLDKAGIDPQRRAETLTLEEWFALWQAYGEGRGI